MYKKYTISKTKGFDESNALRRRVSLWRDEQFRPSFFECPLCTLGSLGSKKAINPLIKLLNIQDDYVEVEAAYALARLGIQEGKDSLIKLLSYPLDAYTAPPIAAGYLAILGDTRGFPVIVSGKISLAPILLFF